MSRMARVCKHDFTKAGAGTTYQALDGNFSYYEYLLLVLNVTSAATDTGDVLSVTLECTIDGTTYEARARFTDVLGDGGAKQEQLRITQIKDPAQTSAEEKVSEPNSLSGGAVLDGPFPAKRRFADPALRSATWRLKFVVTDADGDSAFSGRVEIHAPQDLW